MNQIYAIWDSKAQYYMPFFVERNDACAVRAVENAIRENDHQLKKHSEDYSLFWIGTWDQEHGTITNGNGTPRHVTDCWVIAAQLNQEEN